MNRKAFTLAEVLITLTIIGVIAALTIPNLTRKWSDHADVQKVKEAYSILSNAYRLCIAENGAMENWYWGTNITFPYQIGYGSANQNKISDCLRPYLKVEKYCGLGSGCAPKQSTYTTLDGVKNAWGNWTESNLGGKMLLQNGMYVAISSFKLSSTGIAVDATGPILVDINGDKGPNRYGYDVFFFSVNGTAGIIPLTSPNAGWAQGRLCNPRVKTNSYNHLSGRSCADWVLRKGNMDYKYRDISVEW